ncbi:aminopeptidase N [soil metagenome]
MRRTSQVLSFFTVLMLSAMLTVGCSTASKSVTTSAKTVTPEDQSDLTWVEAKERKERLSNVVYDLAVDLTAGASSEPVARFNGILDLHFSLTNSAKDLRLDFYEGDVKSMTVNGQAVALTQKKKYWIILPGSMLVAGANAVHIEYSQEFSRTGEGLHRFVDPVDKKVYLYTQFETYDANRFVPCFDQPDLRSVLKLRAKAPKSWTVISSALETKNVVQGANRDWTFAPSAEISTYLFSLHAGPYAMMKDTFKRADGSSFPLRVFVRGSLKKYLNETEWFKTTKDGIAFYENYFGVRYPFSKLDQLIVPEFNGGGMENVGAITYYEWSLPRAQVTRKSRRGLSSLLLHEIAHMWFGDLVTMAWWNNLWLNESFATYMSFVSQVEATEFKEAWQTMAASSKNRAYVEDAMVTTHPIEAPIATVKEAMTNFDGITYNKGASVLKQLNYYMTTEDFRSGIRDYFQTYSFKNTDLNQFIGSLQKHTKKDLNLWADRWLRQSGTDTLSAAWTCDKDRLKAVDLTMTPTAGRKPRPQSVEVALFKSSGGKTTVSNRIRADFDGTKNTIHLAGDFECPDFVYPNHDDQGYALVKLDAKSLSFLTDHLSQVDDLITRSLVWNDIWRMVRDTEISLKTYVDIVTHHFGAEKDEVIQQQVLGTIYSPGGSILSYWPTGPAAKADRAKFVITMENEFLRRMKGSASGSDDEKLWYDAFARIAASQNAIEQLQKWFIAGRVSKNFPMDVERSWGAAGLMARYQHPKAADALQTMKKRDTSDRGAKAALAVEASIPTVEVKRRWIGEFIGANGQVSKARTLEETHSVIYSLFPPEQREMKLSFSKDFFNFLEKNRSTDDEQIRVRAVLGGLLPLNCQSTESAKLKEKLNQYSDLTPSIRKSFLMNLEEDERCQRIRARSNL